MIGRAVGLVGGALQIVGERRWFRCRIRFSGCKGRSRGIEIQNKRYPFWTNDGDCNELL